MDRPTFRQVFPEFGSDTAYPDAVVDFWFGQARIQLDPQRWADLLDQGTALFVAHKLVLARRNAAAGTRGIPGEASGPTASKTIDKLSKSFDTGAASLEGAGSWNLTTYGTQFIALARIAGAGGMQL